MANGNPFEGREPMSDTEVLRLLYERVKRWDEHWDEVEQRVTNVERFRTRLEGIFIGWGMLIAPALTAVVTWLLTR